MRLIDADELKDHQFHGLYTNIHIASNTDAYMLGWNDAIDAIVKCAPTVDAEPVKHGEWIGVMTEEWCTFDECKCSVCGDVEYFNKGWKKFSYCPNCGAKMDEEVEE